MYPKCHAYLSETLYGVFMTEEKIFSIMIIMVSNFGVDDDDKR